MNSYAINNLQETSKFLNKGSTSAEIYTQFVDDSDLDSVTSSVTFVTSLQHSLFRNPSLIEPSDSIFERSLFSQAGTSKQGCLNLKLTVKRVKL